MAWRGSGGSSPVSKERKPTSHAASLALFATVDVYCHTPRPSIGSSTPFDSAVEGTGAAEAEKQARVAVQSSFMKADDERIPR